MELRANTVKEILAYRRKSFRFPEDIDTQFGLLLKLYKANIMRHLFPVHLGKYELNHFSGIYMLETLYSKNLCVRGKHFAKTQGWTIEPKKSCCPKCLKSFSYRFDDSVLNAIHFS